MAVLDTISCLVAQPWARASVGTWKGPAEAGRVKAFGNPPLWETQGQTRQTTNFVAPSLSHAPRVAPES